MIRRVALFVLLLMGCSVGLVRATAYTTTPDTVVFTPTGQGTMTGYVRVSYLGDTTMSGDHIHATISSGSSYFSTRHDTVFTKSYIYWAITFTPQSSLVWGSITFTDDTTTRTVILKGNAYPDGEISGYGPYYPTNIARGAVNCQNFRMINTGSDNDTITSVAWTHSTGGTFIWDSSLTFPRILHSHDTLNLNICFHAGTDTNIHTDTLAVYYSDSSSHSRYLVRVVTAQAHDTTSPDGVISSYGPYYPGNVPPGGTNCQNLRMINTGADNDTITSVAWSHSNGGLFIWDSSVTFPRVMHSHDTLNLNICWHAGTDTLVHMDTVVVHYSDAYNHNREFTRIVYAQAHDTSSPDGIITATGPYWSNVPKNGTSCEPLRMINSGADVDTIVSATWSHSTGGMFVWDSSLTFPHVMHSHDTINWSFCFHAPNDTSIHMDTLTVRYNDAYSHTRYFTRFVYGRAIDTTTPDVALIAIGPYWTATIPEGSTNCTYARVINNGADVDTIVGWAWSHDPHGVFTYDSTFSTPVILHSHDTMYVGFCFHAPYDTLRHWDTLLVHYHDAYSQTREFTRIVSAQATDTTIVNCYSLYPQSVPFTEVGDTSRFRVYIHNLLGSSASLTALHFSGSSDASYRVDSSTFPRTIAAHAYDSVWLQFIPRSQSSNSYPATLTGIFSTSDTSHCRTAYASVTGTAAQATRDTASVSMTDTSTKHIALVSDTSVNYYAHRIDLVNNIGIRIRIDTVYLTNTNHIYIAQQIRSHFPDTLVDGAKHSVILHFYGDTSHTVYHDTLVVTMENALAAMYFYVDGYSRPAKSDVLTITRSTATDLRIFPNPSSGMTNILPVGLTPVSYEILDVLGNVVAEHSGSLLWQWTPAVDGADGTYFVRVTGRNSEGNAVVICRRVVVKH